MTLAWLSRPEDDNGDDPTSLACLCRPERGGDGDDLLRLANLRGPDGGDTVTSITLPSLCWYESSGDRNVLLGLCEVS